MLSSGSDDVKKRQEQAKPGPGEKTPSQPGRSPLDDQPTVVANGPILHPDASDINAVMSEFAEPMPGMQLGHFKLLELVGGGGMGRVFRAWDLRLDRPVALKVLDRRQAADPEISRRFINEARSAARLNHEGIAQVYYLGEDKGLPFIAFEFVEGTNLREMVERRGPLPLAEALFYTIQVAEAIAHAASHHVVHRDIKPSNIIVTPEGKAKLIDLGLARLQAIRRADELTATGVTLGTFDYIAPEQARDPRNADELSDIYSLGCTFFYMLTGRPPYPGGTVLQKLLQHQGDEPPDVRQFRPDLPEEVSRVIKRMMAKDRRRRFQSARQVAAVLRALAVKYGAYPLGLVAERTAERARIRQLLLRYFPWLVAAVSMLLAVAMMSWSWRQHSPSPLVPPAWNELARNDSQSRAVEPRAGDATDTAGSTARSRSTATQLDSTGRSAVLPKPTASDVVSESQSAGPGKQTKEPAATTSESETGQGMGTVDLALEPGTDTELTLAPAGLDSALDAGVISLEGGRQTAPPTTAKLLVISSTTGSDNPQTLAQAIEDAADGAVIELQLDGPVELSGFELVDKRISLVASEGYAPTLRLKWPDESTNRESNSGRAAIRLRNARLELTGLQVVLSGSEQPVDSTVGLFELVGKSVLSLRKTIIHVEGSQQGKENEAAVILVSSEGGLGEAAQGNIPATAQVTMRDVVLKADGDAIRVHLPASLDLAWDNGIALLRGRLCTWFNTGTSQVEPRQHVRLSQLAVITLQSPFLLELEKAAAVEPFVVVMEGCLFASPEGVSFFEQFCDGVPSMTGRVISLEGDNNVLVGYGDYLVIRDAATGQPVQVTPMDDWRTLVSGAIRHLEASTPGLQSLLETDLLQLTPADVLAFQDVVGQAASIEGGSVGFLPEFISGLLPTASHK